jgi:hypothetical protein
VTADKFLIDFPMDGFPQMDVTTTILAHIDAGRGAVHPITVKQTADYVRGCPFSLAACAA